MIKSAQMEKPTSMEKLPLNQVAKEIGQSLAQIPKINKLNKIERPYELERIGEASTRERLPYSYQGKRHLFWATILGQKTVVAHFSDVLYCQDPDYFGRVYRNCRDFYSGWSTQFINKKLGPSLLGYDDGTKTLIMERALHDLSFYFSSTDKEAVRQIVEKSFNLFRETWESSKKENDLHPRYVRAFLTPEYFFLEGKKVEDYLKSSTLIDFYKQARDELETYLDRLRRFHFERGFGFPDVKPSNLVEDKDGRILFIDIAKPEYTYHWLNQVGQLYQGAIKEAPHSLFTRILKTQSTKAIESFSQPELAIALFALGRMNRLLISCTLRNIVYGAEIGQPVNEEIIRENLNEISALMKATSVATAMI